MAKPTTERFENLILEVETDPTGASGTYVNLCGLYEVEINREKAVDESEVPADCDDESLPLEVEIATRSITVTASANGVWALQSNKVMTNWFYERGGYGSTLNVRLRHKTAQDEGAAGDPYVEEGPAVLTTLNNSRTKGKKVQAEISLRFDGVPTVTDKT